MIQASLTHKACHTPSTEVLVERDSNANISPGEKVCVLIGASNPVGLCLARSFIEKGYRVAVGDANPADFASLAEGQGNNFLPVKVNPNRDVYVNSMADQVYLRWRRVDVLVNIVFRRNETTQTVTGSLSSANLGLDAVSNLIRVTGAFSSRLQGAELAVVDVAWFEETTSLEAEAVLQAALRTTTSAIARQYFGSGLRINAVHASDVNSTSSSENDVLRTVIHAVQFLANSELSGKLTGNVLEIDPRCR